MSEANIQRFKTMGYVNGGKVLDDDTVEMLRAEVIRMWVVTPGHPIVEGIKEL